MEQKCSRKTGLPYLWNDLLVFSQKAEYTSAMYDRYRLIIALDRRRARDAISQLHCHLHKKARNLSSSNGHHDSYWPTCYCILRNHCALADGASVTPRSDFAFQNEQGARDSKGAFLALWS
jgi:hypothetical protein